MTEPFSTNAVHHTFTVASIPHNEQLSYLIFCPPQHKVQQNPFRLHTQVVSCKNLQGANESENKLPKLVLCSFLYLVHLLPAKPIHPLHVSFAEGPSLKPGSHHL